MYEYQPEFNRERASQGAVVRTPIPEYIRQAFLLDQVIITPRGMYRPYAATLAAWSGTVLAAALTYAGRIDTIKVSKAEVGLVPVPATVHADGQTFEIWVEATNLSSQSIKTGVEVIVTKPDGSKVTPAIDWTATTQGVNSKLTWKYNIAAVNLAGTWTAVITYYAY